MKADRRLLADLAIGVARFRFRDWAYEATVSVMRNPGRSLMTAIGTVLGAAAFVATLGIASTMERQVSDAFDVRRATEVRVVPQADEQPLGWLAPDRIQRLRELNGVVHAGRRLVLSELPISRAVGTPGEATKVIGADPGAVGVIAPSVSVGRVYDEFHEQHNVPVVLLAKPVAERLGIARTGMAVFIGDHAFTVIGIFDDIERRPEALLAAIVPSTVGERLIELGSEAERDVIVSTVPGAAQLISGQSPIALWPENPSILRSIAPPDPRTLRMEVEENLAQSSLLLSGIALIIGAVSIANSATASIAARTPEIGLRRAIGARPLHIFTQLLGETTALGVLGGATGVLIGISATALISIAKGWTPMLDLKSAVLAVAVSAAAGLTAGLWPAARAMRIQPVTALQR